MVTSVAIRLIPQCRLCGVWWRTSPSFLLTARSCIFLFNSITLEIFIMNQYLSSSQVVSLIAAVGHKRTSLSRVRTASARLRCSISYASVCPSLPTTSLCNLSTALSCLMVRCGCLTSTVRMACRVSYPMNASVYPSAFNQLGVNGGKPIMAFLDEIAKAPQFIKNVLLRSSTSKRW
jgi:hypothetical protein